MHACLHVPPFSMHACVCQSAPTAEPTALLNRFVYRYQQQERLLPLAVERKRVDDLADR